MMLLLTVAALLIGASSATVRYDNYTVYRLIPSTEDHLSSLRTMEEYNLRYDFWSDVRGVNMPVDIMVSPQSVDDFKEFVTTNDIPMEVMIENVQDTMDNEKPKMQPRAFGFTDYYRIADIYDWMAQLASSYSSVSLIEPGTSYQGRKIRGARVSFSSQNANRVVVIEGGIHAREWISVAVVAYILNELVTSTDPAIRAVAQRYDWLVFPVFNPDGYEYTFTNDRMWRKTRVPYSGGCYGADPNRNWGYRWNTGGASSNPCSDTYAGPYAFSEPETKSMSDYLSSIQSNVLGYIGFHAYSQLLLFPYGHTTQQIGNYAQLKSVGNAAAQALASRYGTRYTVGNIAETIYVATGSSMDWMAGTYDTKITYTYELRDLGQYGFLLPANQIIPSGLETMDSLVAIMNGFNL